jgi:hypothetical protein
MGLREVARNLALIKNPKAKGINSPELCRLLRAEELRAGFYIGKTIWIDIPMGYWQTVDTAKIKKQINRTGGATYRLKPSKFPDQVASIISNSFPQSEPSSEHSVVSEELAGLIGSISRPYEVTVKVAVFQEYLHRNNIALPPTSSVTRGGRPQKNSWPTLCGYVGAYFGAHVRDFPGCPVEIEATSKRILELAKEDGVGDLPDWTTLKEHVSAGVRYLDSTRFKLRS